MGHAGSYTPVRFPLTGLPGISDRTLEMHFSLYAGYVKNTNLLTAQLMELAHQGQATAMNPTYAELTRHLGFEYGGMVLHEYYFENLAPHGKGDLSGQLKQALEQGFGSVDNWQAAFTAVGNMRGVGRAILYQDPITGRLSNHWIALHHDGVPSGFKPILVMDVWEHAFLPDYKPAERGRYIDAFFANVNWEVVAKRLAAAAAVRAVA